MRGRPPITENLVPSQRAAIGARLRQARIDAGLRLADVAEGLVSVGYLSMIEQGQRTPAPAVLSQLAERVGLDSESIKQVSDEVLSMRLVCNLHLASWAYFTDDLEAADELLVDVIDAGGPMVLEATWLHAHVLMRMRRVTEALETVLALLRNPDFAGKPTWQLAAQMLTGAVLLHAGDGSVALRQLDDSLARLRDGGHPSSVHFALLFGARARVRAGDIAGAARHVYELESLLEDVATLPQLRESADVWWQRRMAALADADYVSAVRFSERAIGLVYECWWADTRVMMLLETLAFHMRFGSLAELDRCEVQVGALMAALSPSESPHVRTGVVLTAAELALARGNVDEVLRLVSELESSPGDHDRAWCTVLKMQVALVQQDHSRAETYADEVRGLLSCDFNEVLRTEQLVEPWEVLSRAYRQLGRDDDAWQCMRIAMRAAGAQPAAPLAAQSTASRRS